MPKPSEVLVYVDNDGSARELSDSEKTYVDRDFRPFDGARPYIKSHYQQRTPAGELRGYLDRTKLPAGTPIAAAPPSTPAASTPQAVADSILELIQKHRAE